MIVSGPHGVEVGSTGGVFAQKDFVFLQCEAGQVAAMARGDWVVWSLVDNLAVSTINQNTVGLRVIHTTTAADVLVAGCLESAYAGQSDALTQRVLPPILVQCYGYHNAAAVRDTGANAAPRHLHTHTNAGEAISIAVAAVTAPQAPARCGYTTVTTINGVHRVGVLVRCM